MRRRTWWLSLVVAVCVVPVVGAQDDDAPEADGLVELLTLAKAQSPVILLSQAERDKARATCADIRLQVARDALTTYTTWRDGAEACELARQEAARTRSMTEAGTTPLSTLAAAQREVHRLEAAHRMAWVQCHYLLGVEPRGDAADGAKGLVVPNTLAEFLELVGRKHPKLAVAQASLTLAEMKHRNRVAEVVRDVCAASAELDWLQKAVRIQSDALELVRAMAGGGRASMASVDEEVLVLAELESKRAETEASLLYLTGSRR